MFISPRIMVLAEVIQSAVRRSYISGMKSEFRGPVDKENSHCKRGAYISMQDTCRKMLQAG